MSLSNIGSINNEKLVDPEESSQLDKDETQDDGRTLTFQKPLKEAREGILYKISIFLHWISLGKY